jgi:hypothetical protein
LAIALEREYREAERDTTLTWAIGLRVNQAMAGKLPDLAQVLRGLRPRQSAREQTAALHQLSEAYNLPIVKRRKRKDTKRG